MRTAISMLKPTAMGPWPPKRGRVCLRKLASLLSIARLQVQGHSTWGGPGALFPGWSLLILTWIRSSPQEGGTTGETKTEKCMFSISLLSSRSFLFVSFQIQCNGCILLQDCILWAVQVLRTRSRFWRKGGVGQGANSTRSSAVYFIKLHWWPWMAYEFVILILQYYPSHHHHKHLQQIMF